MYVIIVILSFAELQQEKCYAIGFARLGQVPAQRKQGLVKKYVFIFIIGSY